MRQIVQFKKVFDCGYAIAKLGCRTLVAESLLTAPSGGEIALLRAAAPSTATSWSGADASASAAAPASCREVTSFENICERRATARSMSTYFPQLRLPSTYRTRNSSRLGSSSSVVFQGRALRFAKCFWKLDFHCLLCDGANFARTHSTSFSGARARRNAMCKRATTTRTHATT